MLIIFIVIVLSSLGFGLVLPAFLFFAQNLGGSAEIATAIVVTYSIGQVISTPVWGRLSDRFGRKPILMFSLLGSSLSYVGMALATDLVTLAAARFLGGLMAGNFSAAMAYVADVTPEDKRAKGMGVVGAGISLGFIVGPALGGVLSGADAQSANLFLPGIAAAGMSLITFLAIALFLKESLSAEQRLKLADRHEHYSLGASLRRVIQRPVVLRMIVIGLLFIAVTGMFETIFPLWANAKFTWGPREVGFLFTYLGVIVGIVQGGLIGPLAARFGEGRLVAAATVSYALGLGIMAQSTVPAWTIFGITFTAIGSSLFNPSMSSLVSRQAGSEERGLVLGIYQSVSWVGRIVGPLAAGVLFGQVGREAPLLAGIVLLVPCLWVVTAIMRRTSAEALSN